MAVQEDIIVLAKTKLADRPVVWKEAYTKRTLFLKKQFHDVLGPGSYFRYEGHDTDTDDEYFVIVGPAKVHSPKSEFFAGVRKLPADYAAGGLYFHDLDEAMQYAHETWGVAIPKEIRYYDSDDLKGIGPKVKKWKEATEDDDINDEDYLVEWYESIKHGEDTAMPVSDSNEELYFYEQSSTYPFFTRVAMPTWLRHEKGFQWWDVDQVFSGDPDFAAAAELQPSLTTAKNMLLKEKSKRQKQIAEMYGRENATNEAGLYRVWLVHRGDRGTYIVSVGPYCGTYFEQALDKFGVFTKKLNAAKNEQIDAEVESLIREYAEKFGIQLDRNDLKIPEEGSLNPTIEVNKIGRQKVFGSPEWKTQILDRYGVQPGPGMTAKLKIKFDDQMRDWKRQVDEAYAVSQENGEAFERQQPPPPSIGLSRRRIGQQQSRSILRQNVKGLSKLEQVEKYGFDSIQEAVEFLETTGMEGAPLGEVPATTSADLKAARIAKEESDAARGIRRNQRKVSTPLKEPQEKPATEPAAEPVQQVEHIEQHHEIDHSLSDDDMDFESIDSFASSSLTRMIKMAEDLDSRGKHKEAEEIHVILRKHIPLSV